jgi:hypothetical protein
MTHNNSEEENILRRIPLEITALSVLIALVAVPFFDPLTGLLVLAGGALAALSFLWLKRTVSQVLPFKNGDGPSYVKNGDSLSRGKNIKKEDSPSDKKRGDSPREEMGQSPFLQSPQDKGKNWGLSSISKKAIRSTLTFYLLRIVLILGIFFIIIFFFSNKILAFVVGFSTLVPVFLAEAVIALSKMKQWKS